MSTIEDKINNLSPECRKKLLAQIKKKRELVGSDDVIDISDSLKEKGMDFSLIFFSGNGSTDSTDKYDLLIECAKFADANGFSAIVTPERHLQPLGGLFPNPSVLSAALAMVTKSIQLRAGSVILPLHNPLRVVEEWSVVDNLSKGRIAISAATGWHPADFILNPSAYGDRRAIMHEHLALIRKLWRGEPVKQKDIEGNDVNITVLPKPIQSELPLFLTSSGNPATWKKAGELGINVLCSLANHTIDDLNANIVAYREERKTHGFDPDIGIVSTMVHTYVGLDNDAVKKKVKEPLRDFLNGYINQNDTLNPYKDQNGMVRSAIDNNREALISYAFEKHFNQTSMMGSKQKCAKIVQKLHDVGVNEVACLIDFGLEKCEVLEGLEPLTELKNLFQKSASIKQPGEHPIYAKIPEEV